MSAIRNAPPAPRDDLIQRLAAVLTLCVDLAESVEDLNRMLVTNRAAIDILATRAPDLWALLRDHTQAVRARLDWADHRAQARGPRKIAGT